VRLLGKAAFITGAASGIGRAAALAFVREGARVALCDVRDPAEVAAEVAAAGGRASTHIADVGSSGAVDRALADAWDDCGGIDSVVANAGIIRDGFLSELSDDDWNEVLRVNLTGVFYVCRAAFPRMKPKGGSIVVTSSIVALGNRGQANYAASKAGLLGLIRTLALEGAASGIRVNAVAPGFTDTAMVSGIPDRVREKLLSRIPLGRLGRPEEIANVMAFLASEEASYITGQAIFVDGGLSVGA
jgi:3-oxoacyl-[acyl-carrier protein] reductase